MSGESKVSVNIPLREFGGIVLLFRPLMVSSPSSLCPAILNPKSVCVGGAERGSSRFASNVKSETSDDFELIGCVIFASRPELMTGPPSVGVRSDVVVGLVGAL